MSITVKLRRGTTTQHSSFTGQEAEVTVDTTKDVVVVHDGVTAGGHPMAKASALANVAFSGDYADLLNIPAAGSGTVTSVALSAPTGFSVTGSPVTTIGTLALSFASGYSLPTTTKQSQWDTAYGWGDHAAANYLDSADIGVIVQGYNANTVIDATYVHTDNNYTTTEKSKLAGIAAGAEVNVNADWNSVSGDSQILNKPTLGTAAATASTDYATAAQGTKADSALQAAAIGVTVQGYSSVLANTTASFTTADETKLDGIAAGAEVNVNADWNAVSGDAQILNKPSLATVATTGAYSDLTGKPTIPSKTSDLTNDSGFITGYTETDPIVGAVNGLVKANGSGTISAATAGTDYLAPSAIGTTVQAYDSDLTSWAGVSTTAKQDTLVSGTNIKTVNGNSLLGSGDLTISGGSSLTVQDEGTTLTSAATSLDFTGAGVTATNSGGAVTVAITSGGISTADIQEFTSTGSSTWTKPTGAKLVYVLMQGGGGGAGSGHKQLAIPVNPNQGGMGGCGGGWTELWIPAVSLGSTETVTVGAGGTGGASQTTSGNGNSGTIGGNSSFGSWGVARGGALGSGGQVAAQGSGQSSSNTANTPAVFATSAAASPLFYTAVGGSRTAGNIGSAGGKGGKGAGGGAGGGGITATPTANTGGAGGLGGAGTDDTATTNTGGGGTAGAVGGAGGNGADAVDYYLGGSGGGSGGSSITANGGDGGTGGYPGGGGGGGGACLSVFNSGAGGNGGGGYIRVVTFF